MEDTNDISSTMFESFSDELEKIAFSVTRKGHEFDAEMASERERNAAKEWEIAQRHGGAGSTEGRGSFRKALRGFTPGAYANPRHQAYTARKHREGKNAWNPFGGMTTPSKYEKGGSKWIYGKFNVPGGKEKKSSLSGASVPSAVEHGAVPYKVRREKYKAYLKEKSKEDPTSKGKAALVGGAIGILGGPAAPVTVPLGALIGAAMAHADKGRIEEAKKVLKSGNIDHAMADQISDMIESREGRRELRQDMRHHQTMAAINRSNRTRSEHHHHYHY